MFKQALTTLALGLGLATGCAVSEAPLDQPANDLASVQIPEGFDFATTRGVQLTAAVQPGTMMEVALPSGAVLYRGPAPASGLGLSVPSKDTTLHIKATHDGVSKDVQVAVVDGAAHFEG